MKKAASTEEQIAYALRQAETGTPVADICRKFGVSEQTFYHLFRAAHRTPFEATQRVARSRQFAARACYARCARKVMKRLGISIAKGRKCNPANVSGNCS